ncbi:MAG: DUF454 domain-containing protein [Saprospirales bacterium]|nr:MAG: DUF454 domain-containing protein [Saprospirales bacterium]
MKEKQGKIDCGTGKSQLVDSSQIPTGESAEDRSPSETCSFRPEVTDRKSETEENFNWRPGDVKRWSLAGLGVFCVGLGALGTVVPGLPTTIFVIIAAWSFSKSCPWLEQRLLRNKMFGPSMEIIDGKRPFTRRARIIAMSMMWFFGSTSIAFLYFTNATPNYVLLIIFLALIAGTVSIVKFNPRSKEVLQTSEEERAD